MPAESTPPRQSYLTGAQIKHILGVLNVQQWVFADHCGVNPRTMRRWLSGECDGAIPVVVEWVLFAYHITPRTRFLRGKLALPVDEWMASPVHQREGLPGRRLIQNGSRSEAVGRPERETA